MKTSLSGALYFTSKLCPGILKVSFVFFPRIAYSDLQFPVWQDFFFLFLKDVVFFFLIKFLLN